MSEDQRKAETVKCYHEIFKTWLTIQDYTKQLDSILYNYECTYVDIRTRLKEQIENGSKRLEFLTAKRSVLLDQKIDLSSIEEAQLDDFISKKNFNQMTLNK